ELDAQAHLERGLLHVQLLQYGDAWADIELASTLDPKRPPWKEVVRALTQVIARYPQHYEAFHLRAHAHAALGQFQEAVDDFSQAIQLDPQRLDFVFWRGIIYRRMGQKDKAAEDFRKAGRLTPSQANYQAWDLVTSPNPLFRDPNLAVELAKQAVRQVPGEADYWNTLGVAHYRSEEWEAAIQALEECEKLAPGKYFGCHAFFLAMCHHQLGDTAKARDHYDRAVRWCRGNEEKLSAQQQQELKAFRAEAEALLAKKSQ